LAVAQDQFGDAAFLTGGGEMSALIRARDWQATRFGPLGTWPQSLRTALSICLNSPAVSAIFWGPELRIFYNDAYALTLVERHPWALGRPLSDVWPEISNVLRPQLAVVMETGQGFTADHQSLALGRHGGEEETVWSYSFAPVRGECGGVAGVYNTATDVTTQVVAERQRREADHAVRAERDRTRRVLDGMAEGFGLLDREFRLIDINAEGLRLEERPREAIIGKTHC
jgi:PAS domain-containing protein